MKRNYQGYIYMSVQKTKEHWRWIAMKTNKEGLLISTFSSSEQGEALSKQLTSFSKWIGNVVDYRAVAYGHESYHSFFSEVERYHSNVFSRHLVRMMKAQLWNIKSECMYRFQIKEKITIEDLLFLYKQDPIHHQDPLMKELINLRTLTTLFLFDNSQTKKLMRKSKEEVINEAYRSFSTDEIFFLFIRKGYSFSIHHLNENEMVIKLVDAEQNVVQEVVGDETKELLVLMATLTHPLMES